MTSLNTTSLHVNVIRVPNLVVKVYLNKMGGETENFNLQRQRLFY